MAQIIKRSIYRIDPLDLDGDIAVGVGLPMGGDQFGTFNLLYSTKEQILSNLKNLILTMKGERIMEPEFGTNIYRLLFESGDPAVLDRRIKDDIKRSVKRWLPILTLDHVGTHIQDHTISIAIAFRIPDFNIEDTFKIDVNR
jgi:phage baseplate assembly protein W